MRNYFVSLLIIALILLSGCSSSTKKETVSLAPASIGILKNPNIPFPLYLSEQIESRQNLATKFSPNVFIIQTGHLLRPNLTKEQNEAILTSLKDKGIDVVSLSMEDFIIADQQQILFEAYPQKFLNSSVVDLNEDNIINKNNITSYVIHNGVVILGLSDKKIDKSLLLDKFLISDYVLAIFRAKKAAIKEAAMTNPPTTIKAFVLVHTMGSEINEVMERLPPNFINSLAD